MQYLKVNRDFIIFTVSRTLALLFKPFFIWLLLAKGLNDISIKVSIYFLITSSLMVFFNNEANVEFYKRKFDTNCSNYLKAKAEYWYYVNSILHILLFLSVTFIAIFLIGGLGLSISMILLLLLVLEKIIDEIQRDLQFEKKFIEWSKATLIKFGIPILFVTLLIFLGITHFLFEIYLLVVLLSMVYVILTNLEKRVLKKVVYLVIRKKGLKLWILYLKNYMNVFVLRQVQAFLSKNIVLADRLIVKFINIELLPQITIIGQVASVGILFVDYFMISNRRKEYVVKKEILQIVGVKKIVTTFLVALFLSSIVMFVVSFNGQISLLKVGVISVFYYSLYAISQHFVQFNFWNRSRNILFLIDVLFFLLLLGLFTPLFSEVGLLRIVMYLCVIHFVRLILQIVLSTNSKNENKD
mgnify:CR=1 FL=1